MSAEYPCVHYNDGRCKKFTEPGCESYCVMGPCPDETPSNSNHFRRMNDEDATDINVGSKWVSVKDKLPKSIANKVIVCCENGYIGYGHFERFGGKEVWYNLETSKPFTDWNDGICEGFMVTHWQPLPEPPKMDAQEGAEE